MPFSAGQKVKKLGMGALRLLYPNTCFLCGAVLQGDKWICDHCSLPVANDWQLCPKCGKQETDCICGQLPGKGLDGISAPLYYIDDVKHGMYRFKYRGITCYTVFLAQLMYARVQDVFQDIHFDLITCVPMTKIKQRKRGYFPARLLARRLSAYMDVPLREDLLFHTGKGGTQMEQKSRDARWENACLNFAVLPDAPRLAGDTVLIVDDVLTSGCTTHRCAMLLRTLGAGNIYGITVATTPEKEEKTLVSL